MNTKLILDYWFGFSVQFASLLIGLRFIIDLVLSLIFESEAVFVGNELFAQWTHIFLLKPLLDAITVINMPTVARKWRDHALHLVIVELVELV